MNLVHRETSKNAVALQALRAMQVLKTLPFLPAGAQLELTLKMEEKPIQEAQWSGV